MTTIEQAIERMNNDKKVTREVIAKELNISTTTLTRRINKAGYVYNQKTKKYHAASPNPGSQETHKESKREVQKESKPEKQEHRKEPIQETRKVIKKVTYEIDEDLHYELRIEAFKERRNVSELVENAIRQYLSRKK